MSSAIAAPSIPAGQATIVKKAVMALTGFVLFAFVTVHLAGNLQVFLGPERLNEYAAFLKSNPELLWGTRIILLIAVIAHIVVTIQLAGLKNQARPIPYARKDNAHSSRASRSMYLTGPMIAAFVVYHLLHLTWGVAHPQFSETDVYSNIVYGFEQWPVSLAYLVAMALLCMHLSHGIYSMFQTLGFAHPVWTPRIKIIGRALALFYFAGFSSIPIAALTRVITANGPMRL
jgi:succinate dehydrogenase / fumarate reductase, cytochrome b subunit